MPKKIRWQADLRSLYLPLALLMASFITLYYHIISKMVIHWSTNENYSHGFLIPLVSAYLIWQNKTKLSTNPRHPSNAGLFLLAGGLALFLLGNLGSELFTTRLSMLIVLLALVVHMAGWSFCKAVSLPIGYLIFMIPLPAIIWYQISFPLKLLATRMAMTLIQWLQVPAYSEGNIIHLSHNSLEVVDACSGLRSLISLLALSAAFALITSHSKSGKWILSLSAIPIAVLLNVLRLVTMALLSNYFGRKLTEDPFHEMSGIFVFIIGFILLCILNFVLYKLPHGTNHVTR